MNHTKATEKLLANLEELYPLSRASAERLLVEAEVSRYEKKQVLAQQGQGSQYVYFVLTGLARAFYYKDGIELTSRLLPEGHVACLVQYHAGEFYYTETLETLEASWLARIHRARLEALLYECPDICIIALKLATQFLQIGERRCYQLRKTSAEERTGYFMETLPDLLNRIPDKIIASYLGITKESYSRTKAELRRKS